MLRLYRLWRQPNATNGYVGTRSENTFYRRIATESLCFTAMGYGGGYTPRRKSPKPLHTVLIRPSHLWMPANLRSSFTF